MIISNLNCFIQASKESSINLPLFVLTIYRYQKLAQPMRDRETLLKDALAGQEFKSRVESEHQWINERLPAMQTAEVGKDFRSSQSLTKKFEVASSILLQSIM